MSKAALIRKLLSEGETPKEIAEKVGCRDAYVRAVRARDRFGGATPADRRWKASERQLKRAKERQRDRWKNDPAFRARKIENLRNWRQRQADGQAS